jgi:hypothetical protein
MAKEDFSSSSIVFNGNLYIFHAFDVGDDINLEKLEKSFILTRRPSTLPKYFKRYHIPLSVELPHPHETSAIYSCKIHSFGVISLTYKIPFEESLEDLRKNINEIDEKYQEQSVSDAASIFKKIKPFINKPKFFHLRTWYPVIQVNPDPAKIDTSIMNDKYGSVIASLIRFETEMLAEYQKNEILESAMGYYHGDFIVIDSEAAFVADAEFEEVFDLFEFANIQQLELQYFDKVLDQKLNLIYERKIQTLPWTSYLPFIGARSTTALNLGRLKVDISVITERLENSVRLTGEAYYSEIYTQLVEKLGLRNWKESLNSKLEIIEDVQEVYQNQIENIREDLLSVLIIILIFIELIVGILTYFKE